MSYQLCAGAQGRIELAVIDIFMDVPFFTFFTEI